MTVTELRETLQALEAAGKGNLPVAVDWEHHGNVETASPMSADEYTIGKFELGDFKAGDVVFLIR